MAEINTQPFLFTASGLLSAATGPNNVGFGKPLSTSGGLTDQPALVKKIRIQGIKVFKFGATLGSVEIFDSNVATPNANDSVYETDVNDVVTNLGVNIKSGDVYVKISGNYKVWLYIDANK